MWLSKPITAVCLSFALMVSACTVEPLNSARSDGAISGNQSVTAALAGSTIKPVNTRVGQQVRNNLLFAINGGKPSTVGAYSITLTSTSKISNLAIEVDSIAPISAKATVTTIYRMADSAGKTITTGKRTAFASFDKTPQSFANERAGLDAENRAAKEVAQQVYLALAQAAAN